MKHVPSLVCCVSRIRSGALPRPLQMRYTRTMSTPSGADLLLRTLPRVRLACLPTPLQRLPRLSASLAGPNGGPEIWVKRDDLTGLGGGGNKLRKLELLLADAQQQGAHTLVTTGGAQSNHARQTAAVAARSGLRCVLALTGQGRPGESGNLLLDRLFGADIRWCGERPPAEVMAEIVAEEASVGRKPYLIPLGGSTAIGAAGYAAGLVELCTQIEALQAADEQAEFDHVIVASGSGGTQAGLLAGAAAQGFAGEIVGIDVGALPGDLGAVIHELANLTAGLLRVHGGVSADRVRVDGRWAGPGYGVITPAEREAISLLARLEGLLLDPIYTGRAMAALIAMVRQGELAAGQRVLFWHTGGAPALHAYARDLG